MATFIEQILKTIGLGGTKAPTITKEWELALDLLENSTRNLFITGKAGTGKSTLLQYFRKASNKRVVVLGPTGMAALNARGMTIHSFFKFAPRFLPPDRSYPRVETRLFSVVDILIIDEVSMVRADLLDAIDRFMRINGRDPSKPFGGARVILIGDLFQLPPVVTEAERDLMDNYYESEYFFSSDAFVQGNFAPIELTTVFRQHDDTFIDVLNAIRHGDVTSEQLEVLNERVMPLKIDQIEKYGMVLTATNRGAETINSTRLHALQEPLKSFEAKTTGEFAPNDDTWPAPRYLQLKKGARVLFIRNDKGGKWVNGTIGTVTEVSDDVIKVQIKTEKFEGEVVVAKETWENIRYELNRQTNELEENVLGTLEQYPLKLAWAITIHKSQGMTLDQLFLDMGKRMFAHGQLYVALSRCRSLPGLHMSDRIWPNDNLIDERIVRFYSTMRSSFRS